MRYAGEVPEWSNGAVSKTVVCFCGPRVRIPPSPLIVESVRNIQGLLHKKQSFLFHYQRVMIEGWVDGRCSKCLLSEGEPLFEHLI